MGALADSGSTALASAFAKFRRGLFVEARQAALALENDPWARYLAAVSAAFEPNLKEFEIHLEFLERSGFRNVYFHYLRAYYSLLQRDVEKALWHYLEIADHDEGWLARSLIKKFRKVKDLEDVEFRVADFIVLPGEIPPAVSVGVNKPADKRSGMAQSHAASRAWQFGKKPARNRWPENFPYAKVFLGGFLLFLVMAIVIVAVPYFQKKPAPQFPDLQVADSAAVMPTGKNGAVRYRYKTREGIIADFEKAKQLLKAKKVNQCRFMLNRLIVSNADFQTREKSRIFLGFIPDLDYADFNDNITLADIFADVPLRKDSLIVVSGEIRDSASESGGTLYQFIVRENGAEYRVHAYRNSGQGEEKSKSSSEKYVQVYGKFKGLVGEQKTIYLEALRLWRQ